MLYFTESKIVSLKPFPLRVSDMELFWNFKVGKQLPFLPISFLTRATPGSSLVCSNCFPIIMPRESPSLFTPASLHEMKKMK